MHAIPQQATYRQYVDLDNLQQLAAATTCYIFIEHNRVAMAYVHAQRAQVLGIAYADLQNIPSLSLSSFQELIKFFPDFNFEKQIVVPVYSNYTILPEAMYVAEKKEAAYKLVHPLRVSDILLNYQHAGLVYLYAMNEVFYRMLKFVFQGADVKPYIAYATQIALYQSQATKNTIWLTIQEGYIEIIHCSQQKLKFHNQFPYESDTDIVYFLLSCLELLNLEAHQLQLIVEGKFTQTSSIIGLLKKYIDKVEIANRETSLTYNNSLREMQDHQYTLYLKPILCELLQAN
jgi:hypothetical protein